MRYIRGATNPPHHVLGREDEKFLRSSYRGVRRRHARRTTKALLVTIGI